MKNNGFSPGKRLASFKYAFNGIKQLFANESNVWIHTFAALCVIVAGFLFGLAVWEWIVLVMTIGLVFTAEAFNSAIETLGDAISPDYNEYIKRAKDIAAGAVFIISLVAVVVGILIFLPKMIVLF